jgi:hypothetical protein
VVVGDDALARGRAQLHAGDKSAKLGRVFSCRCSAREQIRIKRGTRFYHLT